MYSILAPFAAGPDERVAMRIFPYRVSCNRTLAVKCNKMRATEKLNSQPLEIKSANVNIKSVEVFLEKSARASAKFVVFNRLYSVAVLEL